MCFWTIFRAFWTIIEYSDSGQSAERKYGTAVKIGMIFTDEPTLGETFLR
jgi:hypothetical protein